MAKLFEDAVEVGGVGVGEGEDGVVCAYVTAPGQGCHECIDVVTNPELE